MVNVTIITLDHCFTRDEAKQKILWGSFMIFLCVSWTQNLHN